VQILAVHRRLFVAGLEPGLDRADLRPERLHVDDEVLEHGHVPHRRDDRHVAAVDDRLHALLAGEHGAAVHAHAARPADHHATTFPVGERPVEAVLDDVEDVEQARPLGRLDLEVFEPPLARVGVVPPDLQRDVH
jgi:hypothetical protein